MEVEVNPLNEMLRKELLLKVSFVQEFNTRSELIEANLKKLVENL
jgi:hypothetical protein